MAVWHQPGPDAFRLVMSDPKNTPKTPVAETARQEGAQGRTGKGPDDTVTNGEVDASDPVLQAEVTEVADDVHANA